MRDPPGPPRGSSPAVGLGAGRAAALRGPGSDPGELPDGSRAGTPEPAEPAPVRQREPAMHAIHDAPAGATIVQRIGATSPPGRPRSEPVTEALRRSRPCAEPRARGLARPRRRSPTRRIARSASAAGPSGGGRPRRSRGISLAVSAQERSNGSPPTRSPVPRSITSNAPPRGVDPGVRLVAFGPAPGRLPVPACADRSGEQPTPAPPRAGRDLVPQAGRPGPRRSGRVPPFRRAAPADDAREP